MIDLCLKVFDWAKFRKRKGAIKLHLILDHAGHIPSFCVMTPGREHEIEVARGQRYEPDSILSFDRAYVDYHWFDQLHRQGVYFVTRQKRNARYRVLERRPVGPQPGVTSDQVIRLTGKAAQCLSTPLRRIGYRDPETRQFYVFLTNLFHLTAAEVAAIYKARWQIELFFKWVKQHLKLKSFLGTTANAVSDHRKTYFFGLSPTGHRSRQPRLWRGIGGNGSVQRLNRPQIEHRQRVGERRGAGELIVPPP